MTFFYYPNDEETFIKKAVGNYVRTIVYDPISHKVVNIFIRKVKNDFWKQTRKNNIETDHRIKKLVGDHYQIYSWIVDDLNNFGLPSFTSI